MLRFGVGFVALSLAGSAFAQAPPRDNPKPIGTAVIRGRVLSTDGDQPLRRAIVSASIIASQGHTWNALTDANGRFEIRNLPAGSFYISATKPMYVRAVLGQQRPLGPGAPVEIAAGQVLNGVAIRLVKTGVVTGHVIDEFDEPIGNVQVAVLRTQMFQGIRRMMPAGRVATTDESGNYRLYGIQPGDYFLSASLRNFGMLGNSDDQSTYTATYYPGTPIASQAQKLTVTAGQTITEVNFSLLPARAARITGTAFDSQGQPLANARIMAMNPPGSPGGPMSNAAIRADGSFTIGGMAPGEYILRVMTPGGSAESATVPVSIMGDDVTGVQIVTLPPTTLRGHVLLPPGARRPPILRVAAMGIGEVPNNANAEVKPDGSFELKVSTGRILLRVPGAMRLRSVRVGDADVTDSGFDVPPNATVDDIRLELTDVVTQVTGSVVTPSGEKTRDAFVIFFSPDPDRWTFQSRFLTMSSPGASQTYVAHVTPGSYLAVALPSTADRNAWNDPDFLAQLRDRAVPIAVAEGESKTLDLKLTEAPVQ